MSTSIRQPHERNRPLPPLKPGERLDQPAFHARYEAMPEDVKAELVGGVVYMTAALRGPHGRHHMLINTWLGDYWAATPGIDAMDNATTILGEDSEPQPDASLRIIGGNSRQNEDEYIEGPPELIVEIASKTTWYDLHAKRLDYEKWGVQEYLVVVIREERVVWFERQGAAFIEIAPDTDGILRSRVFPGLWLDPLAVFRLDLKRIKDVVKQGIESAEHAEFVAKFELRQMSTMSRATLIRHEDSAPRERSTCGWRHLLISRQDDQVAAWAHAVDIDGAKEHYHRIATELYYVLDGEGTVVLDGVEHPVRKGSIVQIPPGIVHGAKGRMRVLVIGIPDISDGDLYFPEDA